MNQEIIRVPKERIAVLIGTKGAGRRKLEKITNCKLQVDSKEGEVTITGEAFDVFATAPIIKAIARGFNPEIAVELLKEDYTFKLIDIKNFVKNQNSIARVKSRIIGADGKCRKTIENMTETHLVIYGNTVGIIGEHEMVEIAGEAVENILRGSRHGNVYAWLDDKKKKLIAEFYEARQR